MIKETIKHIYIWQQQHKWVPRHCNYRPSILNNSRLHRKRKKMFSGIVSHCPDAPTNLGKPLLVIDKSYYPQIQARSIARYPDDHKLQGNLRVLLCRAQTLALKDGLIREEREYHVWLDGKEGSGGWGYLFTSGRSIIAFNSSVQS